jgi:cytoskeletal protein CcmA (bactofilin family)
MRKSKGSDHGIIPMTKMDDHINTFLGEDTEFEGKLSFKSAVRLDGRFKGEINTHGTLIVGETALIESDIHTAHIIISGEIKGNIVAENRIEIHAPGKIIGNIRAPVVTMEEGVIFEGNCQMMKQREIIEKEMTDKDKKVSILAPSSGSKDEK